MDTLAKTRSVGGSLMITIPAEMVREKSLKEGQLVEIDVKKVRKSGFGLFKGMRPFTKEDELNTEI